MNLMILSQNSKSPNSFTKSFKNEPSMKLEGLKVYSSGFGVTLVVQCVVLSNMFINLYHIYILYIP